MPSRPRVIYWFRTDLRLHDSPALKAALELNPECLYPVWCWDPHYVYRARVGPNRWQYLIDCQSDLSASITKLNPKSKLFVIREAPQTVLPKLCKEWRISHLVFEKDTDAYARDRDKVVIEVAKEAGVDVITKLGRTLYDPDELVKANGGKPTMSISQVQHASAKLSDIPRPIPAPKSLPDPGDATLNFEHDKPTQEPDINGVQRTGDESSYAYLAGPNGDFAVPTMSELGLKPATSPHRGGETIALSQLERIIRDKEYVSTFAKPDTAPTAFDPQATTLLSPHLHFGSLSVREFYWRVQDVISSYKPKKGKPSTIPTNLIGQLLFRDMYFGAQAILGHGFAQTYQNSHCRFVPWHLPSKISPSTGLATGEYEIDSPEVEEWFQRWKYGRTGFPWIDALMRQLRQEGWIHHLGRHAVACFLTRGGCYVDWERGADVFAEWLIDHEVACNSGNWQWLGCVAFYAQFYRCYSPIAFPKKWDKSGAFVRRYVPELKQYSDKYIYEPWKAPIKDQKTWGCLIKTDRGCGQDYPSHPKASEPTNLPTYPKPMFDFAQRREICIQGLKGAYKANIHGDDSRVQDGSWKELFSDDAEGPTTTGSATGRFSKGENANSASGEGGAETEEEEKKEEEEEEEKKSKVPNRRNETEDGRKKRKQSGGKQTTLDGAVSKGKDEVRKKRK